MQVPQIQLPYISSLNLSLFLNKPVLFMVWVAFSVLYFIISSVLMYHWVVYGMSSRSIIVAEILFFSVSVALFIIAGVSVFYF